MLPTINICGLKITRLVVGGNPISGFSHGGDERTREMLDYFTAANTKKLLHDCQAAGINTLLARADNHIMRLLREYRNEGGTIQWLAQSAPERREIVENLMQARSFGADAVYFHGGHVGRLFEAGQQDEVAPILEKLHTLGCPVGMAAHDPAQIDYAFDQDWPVDFFMVCLHNLSGYQGKLGIEQQEAFRDADRRRAFETIARVGTPCIAYKVLAAGRKLPSETFPEVFENIKLTDAVCVGMFPGDDADIARNNAELVRKLLKSPRRAAAVVS